MNGQVDAFINCIQLAEALPVWPLLLRHRLQLWPLGSEERQR